MAYFYTYMDPAEIEAQFKKNVDDDKDDGAMKQKMNFTRDSVESDDEKDENKQTQLWKKKEQCDAMTPLRQYG